MTERLDGFVGTNQEYVSYLERELLAARQSENAEDSRTAKKRCTSGPDSDPYWKTCAKRLVEITPMSQSWTSSLRESGIHEILESGEAVKCLLDSKLESQLSARTIEAGNVGDTDDLPLATLRTYARTTAMRSSLASAALALANFQKFLVISACAVLAEGDAPTAKVYDIVRICVGTKSTDGYCKRTMASAKFLNKLIDTLDMHDWGQRAAELPLLWNRAPSYYYSLACSRKSSLDYLKLHLCLGKFTTNPEDSPKWTPIFVPSLVFHILGKCKTIEHVSHVLGYQKAHLLAPRMNPWEALRGHEQVSTNIV